MKKSTKRIPSPSFLLAKPSHSKNNKPGQNQLVTIKRCILNVIDLLGTVNPLIFKRSLSKRSHQ